MDKKRIQMIRGDTLSFQVEFVDPIGSINSVYFTCRRSPNESIVFQKSINNGVSLIDGSSFRVKISPNDTKDLPARTYVYDLQVGIGSDVYTVLIGDFDIEQDITY